MKDVDDKTIGFQSTVMQHQPFTYVGSLRMSLVMKSLASADTLSNSSTLKSHRASVMFAIVSFSLSPRNGERPDNLKYVGIVI